MILENYPMFKGLWRLQVCSHTHFGAKKKLDAYPTKAPRAKIFRYFWFDRALKAV